MQLQRQPMQMTTERAASTQCPFIIPPGLRRGLAVMALVRRMGALCRALRSSIALAMMLPLAGGAALAADFCVKGSGTYGGVVVTTTGTGCSRYLDYDGIDGLWIRGSESCTFDFSTPVANAAIPIRAHDCLASSTLCDKLVVDVNGSHYPFNAAELVTPDSPTGKAVSIDWYGDIRGTPVSGPVGGSARARFSTAAVSSIKLAQPVPSSSTSDAYGSIYQVCFSTPAPQLTLSKTASAARFMVGVPASYTLTLATVNGMWTSAAATITDTVPDSLTIGIPPAGCSKNGQVVTCTVPSGMTAFSTFVIPVTPTASAVPSVTNTATAVGGGDAACNGTGACTSKVTIPVDVPPTITTKKTASVRPFVAGAPNQFYRVAITVSGSVTTASIFVTDFLPAGITLQGAPTVVRGTTNGSLSGCPASGNTITTTCAIAAGIAPGTFEVQIPVNVGALGVGANGGANTVNLSGGGDAACTSASAEACDATTPTTPVVLPVPKLQIIKTVANGSGSNLFRFALSGLSASSDAITVGGAASAAGSLAIIGTAGREASIAETSPSGWPANPVSASCVDPASATPTTTFGVLKGNALTIPASRMVAGADIRCTFVNSVGVVVTGLVFNDNGASAGVPNDGLVNGGEKGLAGVAMRLTNCAATVHATAQTDGLGQYSLPAPSAMVIAAGTTVCVEESTPAGYRSVGASVGTVRLPSGAGTISAGKTYTYTRTAVGTPDRIAFLWDGSTRAGLNFGDVALGVFETDGAKAGLPGSVLTYAHTFTAPTGGTVKFSALGDATVPPVDGWGAKIYADAGCKGELQSSATLLYPPSLATAVVAGQNICIVMQAFIPASAALGAHHGTTVQADFGFSNASPALSATYTVQDTTTVSSSALALKKEVRNATRSGTFGINNQAKSGDLLEYQITYTNNGPTPIGELSLSDITPASTTFVRAQEGPTPAGLTACTKSTPANPVPAPPVTCATAQSTGGVGAVSWRFAGHLGPGGTGAVLFVVKVD